jgi:hypothetical protein
MLNLEGFNFYANIIQLLSYQQLLEQANNDDLMRELQNQDECYLKTIIKNQAEIIQRLERIENARKIN